MNSVMRDGPELARLYDRISDLQFEGGKKLVAMMGVKKGDAVLDVGCGTGRLAVHLAGIVGPSGSVTGIDPSPHRISIAEEKLKGQGHRQRPHPHRQGRRPGRLPGRRVRPRNLQLGLPLDSGQGCCARGSAPGAAGRRQDRHEHRGQGPSLCHEADHGGPHREKVPGAVAHGRRNEPYAGRRQESWANCCKRPASGTYGSRPCPKSTSILRRSSYSNSWRPARSATS